MLFSVIVVVLPAPTQSPASTSMATRTCTACEARTESITSRCAGSSTMRVIRPAAAGDAGKPAKPDWSELLAGIGPAPLPR
mgnify:CR=1 FL=1